MIGVKVQLKKKLYFKRQQITETHLCEVIIITWNDYGKTHQNFYCRVSEVPLVLMEIKGRRVRTVLRESR